MLIAYSFLVCAWEEFAEVGQYGNGDVGKVSQIEKVFPIVSS